MSPIGYTITRAPSWTVPSRTRHGKDHTVYQITESGELACSCEAGQYGRQCWHRAFVRDGHAGKPRMRVTAPARPVEVMAPKPEPQRRPSGLPTPTREEIDELWAPRTAVA